MLLRSTYILLLALARVSGLGGDVSAQSAATPAQIEFFEKRIRPVLAEHCYECHSADSKKLKGGLHLDTREGVLRGGETRAAVVPGDAAKSLLIEAVRYTNRELQMPPHGKLPDDLVTDLVTWVQQGATDPRDGEGRLNSPPPVSANPAHWAFQPIREAKPPATLNADWDTSSPVDRFIQVQLAEKNLKPAPLADRRVWVRRLYFDLLGLPPTPDETEAFVSDAAPDAFTRLVDRLLASPRYGERWGRWWLDLARYADTNGQDENKVMSNAWRYRDWVIRAFNANLPFDQFTTLQLAGDLLPTNGVSEAVLFDRWTATGFLVLGPKMLAEQDKPKLVMDLVDEQIDVVTRAFLGLTVGCARCHDHKFDPIPTRDYYALAGIFKSTRTMENLEFVSKFNERRIATQEQLAAIAAHEQSLRTTDQAIESAISQANAALREGRKQNFVASLAAAAEELNRHSSNATASTAGPARPANTAPTRTNAEPILEPTSRLVQLLAADPDTNRVSRTLRELAKTPDRVPTFLQGLESATTNAIGLQLAPGKVGAAFLATGSNYLELAHSLALDPSQLTVEAWVQVDEIPKDGDTRRWLVNKNGNEWMEGHYALMLDRNRPGAYLNIGGGKENVFAVWSDGPKLQTNRWHHLAFTYDGAQLRLFVDGQPAGESVIQRPRVAGTTPLALGRRQDGYVNFKGRLDEVRVFSRALPAAELAEHFEHPELPVAGGVVARWDFNELSEAEQQNVTQAELHEALFGADGALALPGDPRPAYPIETRDAIARLEHERDLLKSTAPSPAAFALAVADDQPVDLPVFARGSHLNPGSNSVPRGFIQVANPGPPRPVTPNQSGRLELARWLTSPENPLTARVIVNRVWQAHFGEGLVRTPDNFGLRGEAPSHPELLDWLAREFIRSDWDLKHLHRLILNSHTYRQVGTDGKPARDSIPEISSGTTTSTADPDNRLLAHFPRQRLEAEMVRDALLAVSDRLEQAIGGTMVSWKNNDYVPAAEVSDQTVRRSVYLPIVRDRVYDVLTIFDFANPSVGTAKRTPTVVSHQALFFLNSPLVKTCARAMAAALLESTEATDTERVNQAYYRAFSRPATEAESQRALRFLTRVESPSGTERRIESWAALCQTLLAANEFLYRE